LSLLARNAVDRRAGIAYPSTGEATVSYCGDTTMKRWAWAAGLALAMGSLVAGCNKSPIIFKYETSSASDNTPSDKGTKRGSDKDATGSRGKEETDEKKLLGTWVGTSIESGGETTPIRPDDSDESFFIFSKGGMVTMKRPRFVGVSESQEEGTFKINATKTPKEIDLIVPEGGKQKIVAAIYQLDGDTLKMAYSTLRGMEGDRRPTSFDSKQAFVVINTLKRDNGAPVGVKKP
jgi:uncharacterized protein (TIGR03067 family)